MVTMESHNMLLDDDLLFCVSITWWYYRSDTSHPFFYPSLSPSLPLSFEAMGDLTTFRLFPSWDFLGFSSASMKTLEDLCIIPSLTSSSDRRDWHDIRGKWLLRNLDRSWWHRHTSIKLFWRQLMYPMWDVKRAELNVKSIFSSNRFD